MDVPFAAVSVPAGNGDGTANLMSSSSTELQRLDALAVNEALTPKDEVNDVLGISGHIWTKVELDGVGHMAQMAVCTARICSVFNQFVRVCAVCFGVS